MKSINVCIFNKTALFLAVIFQLGGSWPCAGLGSTGQTGPSHSRVLGERLGLPGLLPGVCHPCFPADVLGPISELWEWEQQGSWPVCLPPPPPIPLPPHTLAPKRCSSGPDTVKPEVASVSPSSPGKMQLPLAPPFAPPGASSTLSCHRAGAGQCPRLSHSLECSL